MDTLSVNEGAGAIAPPLSNLPALGIHERWVEGFEYIEHRYTVDIHGVVRSYCRSLPSILKPYTRNGYLCVQLFDGIEPKAVKVSDLVASAFLGTKLYIFIDGNKTNPALSNLRANNDTLLEDEQWIPMFEGEYSLNRSGDLFSFKGNEKRSIARTRCKDGRRLACLTGTKCRKVIDVEKQLLKNILYVIR